MVGELSTRLSLLSWPFHPKSLRSEPEAKKAKLQEPAAEEPSSDPDYQQFRYVQMGIRIPSLKNLEEQVLEARARVIECDFSTSVFS